MQRMENRTLKRFAISFLCVLVLPVIFFICLFMSDYKEIYQSKVGEQAKNALTVVAKELDRHIDTLYDIVIYNSRLNHFQSHSVANDITGNEIMTTLSAEKAVHPIIENVYYYNALKPDKIYTSMGTYTLDYYAKLVEGLEGKEELLNGWNNLDGDGWLQLKGEFGNDREEYALRYVIRTKNREMWIFTFSIEEIGKILGEEGVDTILSDGAGNQLYVAKRRQDVGEKCFELSVSSQNGYFKLVRLNNEEDLFFEVVSWQKHFWVTVGIVMVIGFLLVLVLTFYNEYPIRKLQKYCAEKVHNIPKNLAGMEIFMFSFQNIEEKVALLEQKQKNERLLLQLLLDEHCDAEDFRMKLNEMGIFTHAECYRVIIAVLQKEDNWPKLELCVEQETLNEYEIFSLDILESNVLVMLIGMPLNKDILFEQEMQRVTERMHDVINDEVRFFLGNSCKNLDGMNDSYKQALMAWQGNGEDIGRGVVCYQEPKKTEIHFRYPSNEIRLLYEALVEINFEKASMITDVLVEMLRTNCDNGFLCASLYYDVFNAYYNACAKLEQDGSARTLDIEFLDIKDVQTMIQMIMEIREQFNLYISGEDEEKSNKNIITKVTAYIDENITNYELSVSMLADYFNISISNLSHQFKAQMNCTISSYITEKRFAYASELLLRTDYTVSAIAELLGYSQARSFIRKFRQYYGMTPTEYRCKHAVNS